jgi:MFS transporter, DHA1 family, multidrug resistance protein
LNALGFGWMFAYVSGSSIFFMDILGLSSAAYAGAFACTGAGIVIGATLNGRFASLGGKHTPKAAALFDQAAIAR